MFPQYFYNRELKDQWKTEMIMASSYNMWPSHILQLKRGWECKLGKVESLPSMHMVPGLNPKRERMKERKGENWFTFDLSKVLAQSLPCNVCNKYLMSA